MARRWMEIDSANVLFAENPDLRLIPSQVSSWSDSQTRDPVAIILILYAKKKRGTQKKNKRAEIWMKLLSKSTGGVITRSIGLATKNSQLKKRTTIQQNRNRYRYRWVLYVCCHQSSPTKLFFLSLFITSSMNGIIIYRRMKYYYCYYMIIQHYY